MIHIFQNIQATDGSQSRTEGECLPEQKGDISESQVITHIEYFNIM